MQAKRRGPALATREQNHVKAVAYISKPALWSTPRTDRPDKHLEFDKMCRFSSSASGYFDLGMAAAVHRTSGFRIRRRRRWFRRSMPNSRAPNATRRRLGRYVHAALVLAKRGWRAAHAKPERSTRVCNAA